MQRGMRITAIILTVCIAAMLGSCKKTKHEHQYSEEWYHDETYHWQIPICGDTDEPGNKSVHNFVQGVCHLCGYSPNKLPDYYDITYAVSGVGGKIEGELNQRIKRGGNAQPVKAIPDKGFLFVMWDDGEIDADRQDKNVNAPMTIMAIFEPDPDDPNNDDDENFGNDHPEEEDDTVEKGDSDEEDGLIFTEIKTLVDNEVTGYSVKLGKSGPFNGKIPDTHKEKPVLEIDNEGFAGSSVKEITLPKQLTKIGHKAFMNCTALQSIDIPDSVLDVGNQAFQNCYYLQSVKLSANMKGVWYKMFYRCSSLTEITLPDSIESLGRYAFCYCSNLKKITFGNGIKKCGAKAFQACTALKEVHVSDLKAWCETEFDFFSLALSSTFESNPLFYAKNLYLNDNLVEDLVVPDGTAMISSYAFMDCESLKTVKVASSVRTMGTMVFFACTNLESVEFEEGLISMEYLVFGKCYKLKKVIFPDSMEEMGYDPDALEHIGSDIFSLCNELEVVVLGSGLKKIDYTLCAACLKLENVYYNGTLEGWNSMDRNANWLNSCKPTLVVHCLEDKKDITYVEEWVVEGYLKFPRYKQTTIVDCNHNIQIRTGG